MTTAQIIRDNFLQAIKIKPFILRTCSICGGPLTFEFRGEQLGFDGSCDCSSFGGWEPRAVEELDFYLDPAHGHIPRIEAFITETLSVRPE